MVNGSVCGNVSEDQGFSIFEYIAFRSVVNGSVSEDRVSDMFSQLWVESRSGCDEWKYG